MAPEMSEVAETAENNIRVAVQLLIHAYGEVNARSIAGQIMADHFAFETARRANTPFLPGLPLN